MAVSFLGGVGAAGAAQECVPAGTWAAPSAQGPVRLSAREAIERMVKRPVVLLGEVHDRADHHRWQLQTMAALHALGNGIVLGLEMFPRRVQAVLDRWVAGELTDAQFLERSDWAQVWRFEPTLYLPLFHFARMNRLPMVALNVERALIRKIGREGADAVPEAMREGVGRPASVTSAYRDELYAVYLEHAQSQSAGIDDTQFLRFVEGQLTWDRAMAEAILGAREKYPGRQVVAVMGRGHTGPGAVPHQLRALGIADTAVLLPWERDGECSRLVPGVADAVFGIGTPRAGAPDAPRPLLGVMLATAEGGGVRIDRVSNGSIAEGAGLRAGDIVVAIAGTAVKVAADLQRVVGRQAPGTWLPIRVRRDGVELEVIAKFPPE